jgi:hypothetical protein
VASRAVQTGAGARVRLVLGDRAAVAGHVFSNTDAVLVVAHSWVIYTKGIRIAHD